MLQPVERSDECVGPGPVVGEAQLGLSSGAHDHPGDVEQAVAEPFGLGDGEVDAVADVPGDDPGARHGQL